MRLHCHFKFSRASVMFLKTFKLFPVFLYRFILFSIFNVVEKFQSLGGPFTKQGLNVSQEKANGNGLFELNSFLRHFPLNQCGQTPSGSEPLVDTFTNLSDDGHRHNGDSASRSCRYKRLNHSSNRLYHSLEIKLSQLTSLLRIIFIIGSGKTV